MINRRNLFVAAGAAALPLGTTSCAGSSWLTDPNVGKVAEYVDEVASGLLDAIQELGTIQIPAVVGTAIGAIQALAQQVKDAASVAAQQPLVQKIVTYANKVFAALIPVASGAGLGVVVATLQAAQLILPIVMSLVGLFVPQAATAAAAKTGMSEAQAHLILRRAKQRLN